jgi:hypothetical protein
MPKEPPQLSGSRKKYKYNLLYDSLTYSVLSRLKSLKFLTVTLWLLLQLRWITSCSFWRRLQLLQTSEPLRPHMHTSLFFANWIVVGHIDIQYSHNELSTLKGIPDATIGIVFFCAISLTMKGSRHYLVRSPAWLQTFISDLTKGGHEEEMKRWESKNHARGNLEGRPRNIFLLEKIIFFQLIRKFTLFVEPIGTYRVQRNPWIEHNTLDFWTHTCFRHVGPIPLNCKEISCDENLHKYPIWSYDQKSWPEGQTHSILLILVDFRTWYMTKLKLNSMAWARELTIPAERPPFVGEVTVNFYG